MLRAARLGLYLSDCHFFNFGVQLSENATEHRVVIIDAGSRGIQTGAPWPKSKVNTTVMYKFWKACADASAPNKEIKEMWIASGNNEQCIQTATKAWQASPLLTESEEDTCAIWQRMLAENVFRRSGAHATSAYKIMELVGRFTAEDQWSEAFAWACYKAAEELRSQLIEDANNILDVLYQRLIYTRTENAELHDVIEFWGCLHEYREQECRRRMIQIGEDNSVTSDQASELLESFKFHELWYELTYAQRLLKQRFWRCMLNTILHKRAGWTHAARAIMEYGLPKLEQHDDATEHINALGQFAQDMAKWLVNFASSMHAYRQLDAYQKNYQTSMKALEKRRRKSPESD
jgi:hypothetical protein